MPLAISGTYAEFRTCSIYAGACHFSGEIMVDGRSAITAFIFESGLYQGVPLNGASVVVLTQAEKNLSFRPPRRSALFVHAESEAQKRAALSAVKELSGVDMGENTGIWTASLRVSIEKNTTSWTLSDAQGNILFQALTSDRECKACSMPGEVWYEPLARGTTVRVATVEEQVLTTPFLGEKWRRTNEAAAFVGRFVW